MPAEFNDLKFKNRGDMATVHGNELMAMKILDSKPVFCVAIQSGLGCHLVLKMELMHRLRSTIKILQPKVGEKLKLMAELIL